MAFLQEALDDPTAAPCGRCDVCAGPWYSSDVPEAAAEAASAVLDRPGVELVAPRACGRPVPTGSASTSRARSRRPTSSRPAGPSPGSPTWAGDSGCAPCSGTTASAAVVDLEAPGIEEDPDAAFDVPVRRSPSDVPPDDELLRACARVLGVVGLGGAAGRRRSRSPRAAGRSWSPGVAQGLARLGRLPYLGALDLAHGGPTGGPGGNSAFRLAARVGPDRRRARAAGGARRSWATYPVLLVDDLADSRWTMTVAGRELRRAGAAAVLPFALALTA